MKGYVCSKAQVARLRRCIAVTVSRIGTNLLLLPLPLPVCRPSHAPHVLTSLLGLTCLSLLPSSVQVLGTSSVQLSQLSEVLAPHLSPMQPLQITHTIK